MAEKKITAPLYPNTQRQLRALEKLDGVLLEASQCLVEQIEGKVRRLKLCLFGDQPVRARTAHPYGDAPITGVKISRDGKEGWNAELTFEVPAEAPECRRRHASELAGAAALAANAAHGSDDALAATRATA